MWANIIWKAILKKIILISMHFLLTMGLYSNKNNNNDDHKDLKNKVVIDCQ